MINPLIPIGFSAAIIFAFVLWGVIYTTLTGKPFIVFNKEHGNLARVSGLSEKDDAASSDALVRFIQTPNRDNYLAMRSQLVASEQYEPYSDEFDQAVELSEQLKTVDAKQVLQKAMPNLVLSPRAHQLLGFLCHKLGDENSAQLEMAIAHACIEGILSTGDGTEGKPFLIARTSDEYDLVEHLDKELQNQSLRHEGNRHFDVVECSDGSKYWFDITDAYNSLSASFK